MDAERLLGELLRAGMRSGSRVRHGHRGRHGHGMGRVLTSPQGLTILGGIAIAAWEHLQEKGIVGGGSRGPGGGARTQTQPGTGPISEGPSFAPPPPPTPEELKAQALLLVEAMVLAAKADGAVDAEERSRLLGELEKSGASDEDRAWLESEIAKPADVDSLIARVNNPRLAAEVYTASVAVCGNDAPAERAYLGLLSARLGLDGALIAEINRRVEEQGTEAGA